MNRDLIYKLTAMAKAYAQYEKTYYGKVALQNSVDTESKPSYEKSILECENGMKLEMAAFQRLINNPSIDCIELIGLYADGKSLEFNDRVSAIAA